MGDRRKIARWSLVILIVAIVEFIFYRDEGLPGVIFSILFLTGIVFGLQLPSFLIRKGLSLLPKELPAYKARILSCRILGVLGFFTAAYLSYKYPNAKFFWKFAEGIAWAVVIWISCYCPRCGKFLRIKQRGGRIFSATNYFAAEGPCPACAFKFRDESVSSDEALTVQ